MAEFLDEDDRCKISGLYPEQCYHCLGHSLNDEDEPLTFEGLLKGYNGRV